MQDGANATNVGSYASVQGLEQRIQQVEALLRAKRPAEVSSDAAPTPAASPSLRALHLSAASRPGSAAAAEASTLLLGDAELEVTGTLRLSGALSPTRPRSASRATTTLGLQQPRSPTAHPLTYNTSIEDVPTRWQLAALPGPASSPTSTGVWEAQKNQVILQLSRDLQRAQALATHAAAVVTSSAEQSSFTPPPARSITLTHTTGPYSGAAHVAQGVRSLPSTALAAPAAGTAAGTAAGGLPAPATSSNMVEPVSGSTCRPSSATPAPPPHSASPATAPQPSYTAPIPSPTLPPPFPTPSTQRPPSSSTLLRDPSPPRQPPAPTLPPHPLLAATPLFRSPAQASPPATSAAASSLATLLGTTRPRSMMAAAEAAGVGTWEGQRGAALLSLEKEVKRLREYAQQQAEVETGLRQALAASEVAAARQVERSLEVAAAAMQHRVTRLLAARCFAAWQRRAKRAARLRKGLGVWQRRALRRCLEAWWAEVAEERQLASARMEASIAAWRAKCAASRWEAQQLLLSGMQRGVRLLRAWRGVVHRRQEKLRRYQHMHGIWAMRVAARVLALWLGELAAGKERGLRLERRLGKDRALGVIKAWRQQVDKSHRVQAVARARTLLRCLHQWRRVVDSAAAARRCIQVVQRRHMRNVLRCWRQVATRSALLRPRVQAAAEATRQRQARAALRALARHCSICKGARRLAHAKATALLRGWQAAAQQRVQYRQAEAILRAAHKQRTLRGIFGAWLVVVLQEREGRLRGSCQQLQGRVKALESDVAAARKLRGAAEEQAVAVRQHNSALQHAALSAAVSVGADHLFSPTLAWKAVTPGTPSAYAPAPRARHFAMALHVGLKDPPLQPPAAPATALAGSASAAPDGMPREAPVVPAGGPHGYEVVVAVFGGTRQDTWLSDVEIVTASCSGCGEAAWAVDSRAAATTAAVQQPGAQAASSGMSLRVDFAACGGLDGHSFYVMGGFDGEQELQDLHCCRLLQLDSGGWQAAWEGLQPRNRSPPPRSHHSLTLCPTSGSLYAFGGHSSSGGLLNDLWAFHTGHREWWAPNTTGDAPTPRRGHVAAVCGGLLLVHGGFDGAGHLRDLHSLNLSTWQWSKEACQGVAPSARRGHAAAVVGDRYLLVHGGYDGEQQLADAYVLDTRTRTWTLLHAAGTAAEVPSARALHSLVVAGPGAFLLGGVGPLGALGDMHLLLDTALAQGEMLKADWVEAAAKLAEARSCCAAMSTELDAERAAAAAATAEAQEAKAQLQRLAERYQQAVQDAHTLRDKLQRQRWATSTAEEAAQAAAQQLQALRRKLGRAEEGGVELADAAEGLSAELDAARERMARLEASLQRANARAASSQQHAQRCTQEAGRLQALAAAARADAAAATAGAEAMRAQCAAVLQEQAAVMRQQLELVREVAMQREAVAAAAGPRPATAPASTAPSSSTPFATPDTTTASPAPAAIPLPATGPSSTTAPPTPNDPVPLHLAAAPGAPSGSQPPALALLPQQLSQVVSDFASQFARAQGAETQLALLQQHVRHLEGQLVSARIQAATAQREAEAARQEADDCRLQLRSGEALQALELQQLRGQLALLQGAPPAAAGLAAAAAAASAAAEGGGVGGSAGAGGVDEDGAGAGGAAGRGGSVAETGGTAAACGPAHVLHSSGGAHSPSSRGGHVWGALAPRPGVGWVPDETLGEVAWELKQHVDLVQSRFGPLPAHNQLDASTAPSWARPLLHVPAGNPPGAPAPAASSPRRQSAGSSASPAYAPPPLAHPPSPLRAPDSLSNFNPLHPTPPAPASPRPPVRPPASHPAPAASPPPRPLSAAARLAARLQAAAPTIPPTAPSTVPSPQPQPTATSLAPPSPSRLADLPIPTPNIPPMPAILQQPPSPGPLDSTPYISRSPLRDKLPPRLLAESSSGLPHGAIHTTCEYGISDSHDTSGPLPSPSRRTASQPAGLVEAGRERSGRVAGAQVVGALREASSAGGMMGLQVQEAGSTEQGAEADAAGDQLGAAGQVVLPEVQKLFDMRLALGSIGSGGSAG